MPGDSGGPVFDDEGEVIGMTTAASSVRARSPTRSTIEDALVIAHQIDSGVASDTVTIGYPAFLGVSLSADGSVIAGVLEGTPAASAGLAAGDMITSVNGVAVGSLSRRTRSVRAGRHRRADLDHSSTGADVLGQRHADRRTRRLTPPE